METRDEQTETRLSELLKEKQQADKLLLRLGAVITLSMSMVMFALIMVAAFAEMPDWARITLIVIGIVPFTAGIVIALRIDQIVGYYHCEKCGNRYVPSFRSILWSVHSGTIRHMKCPKCGKKSWQKKVTTKF